MTHWNKLSEQKPEKPGWYVAQVAAGDPKHPTVGDATWLDAFYFDGKPDFEAEMWEAEYVTHWAELTLPESDYPSALKKLAGEK